MPIKYRSKARNSKNDEGSSTEYLAVGMAMGKVWVGSDQTLKDLLDPDPYGLQGRGYGASV